MEIYRDLFIHCGREQFDVLMASVEHALPNGWRRDQEAEGRLRSLALSSEHPSYCFSCTAVAGRPAALVSLMERDAGRFYVPNVVPHQTGQLTYKEYNGILAEFHSILRPCAERIGVHADLTAGDADLESWLSAEAAQRLRRSLHPPTRGQEPRTPATANGGTSSSSRPMMRSAI